MPGRTVLLSPHLDDAAFCLGAALLDRRLGEVEVLNVFSVSDYAATSAAGNTERVTALRRREDERFFARIPAVRPIYLERRDAPLRLDIRWQSVCDERSWRGNESEIRNLVEAVNLRLNRHAEVLVLAPLGLGGHIDHLVVRQAALRLMRSGAAVGFYEDLPYAGMIGLPAIATAAASLGRIARKKLVPHVLLARSRPAAKASAIRVYRSQLNPSTVRRVVAHGSRIDRRGFAERIWLTARGDAVLSTLRR